MATSLARQLQGLAAPQTDTFLHQGRKKASLLFDPSEAANYDFKDVYGIGLAGLQELQLLPNGDIFSRLEPVLFGEVSQTVERSVRTQEVNRQLDESIEEFLRIVSPYIMLGPAQKALEWLVVRFHIHQYNIDAVMLAFLPYHETKIFVRMVQLLEFQFNKKWEWLQGVQKKGVVLNKKDLLKYLGREGWFQQFLCDEMIRRAEDRPVEAQPTAGERPNRTGNDVYSKFFSSTILALLYDLREIENPLISVLLPCMGRCLQSEGRDYRLTAYAVIATLSQRIKLKEETNKILALAFGEAILKYGDENGMKALSIIVTAHERTTISDKVFNLLGNREFFNLAVKCINEAKLTGFFWIVFNTAVEMLFQPGNPSTNALVDFLSAFTSKVHLDDATKARVVRHIVKKTLELKTDVTQIDLPLGRCLAKLRDLEPATWSTLLNEMGATNDRLLERLDLTFIQESDAINLPSTSPTTSLFLRLNHPNTALRMQAAKELISARPTEDVSLEFLADMVRDRLNDTDPGVVEQVLADAERLKKIVAVGDLKELMVKLLCRLEEKEKRDRWNEVEARAVTVLRRVGDLEDFLPFLVGAIFRRNQRLLHCTHLGDLFPQCLASLKDRAPLSKLLENVVDDFVSRSGDATFPSTKRLNCLLERPEFPSCTALCTLTVLVEVVGRLDMFFLSTDASAILDCVQAFLKRVSLTGRVLTEEHMEQSLSHVKKGKLSGAVVLGWCSLLWPNMSFDARTNPDALLRAAKFVLDDVSAVRDKFFGKSLVVVFVCSVLKETRILAALLTSVLRRPESKSSFCRNIISLCAEACLVMKQEVLEDSVVGEILGVAIPAMRHQDPRMRQGGLRLLKNLKSRHRFRSIEVETLLDPLIAGQDQIEMDGVATAQILGNMFLDPPQGERTKKVWLDLLLQPVQSSSELIRLNVLIALRQVKPLAVFMTLQPMVDRLISSYADLDAAIDVRILNECLERLDSLRSFPLSPDVEEVVLKTILAVLRLPSKLNVESPAEVILRQMFFMTPSQLGEGFFNRILQEILMVYVDRINPTTSDAFRRYLKHVRIPGRLIIAQLNDLQRVDSPLKSASKRQPAQGLAKLNNPTRQTTAFWQRVASLLEVVQAKKKVSDVNLLVKELFDLAKETVVLDQNVHLLEDLENVRRLIFNTINFHCKRQADTKADDQDRLVVDTSVFDVSAIVECIRSSTDTQTHLSALTLLSTLATIMPANVMQNCMTIFTLTGNKLLHKDDQYSVEVVGRTIDVIVPVMLQGCKETGSHNTVRAVMEMFVDALPHMPVQRRQFLFQRLLRVAGGEDNLWILVVLLMNVYVVKGLSVEDADLVKRKSYPVLCEFLEQLFEGMPVEAQVRNLQQATEYIMSTNMSAKSSANSKIQPKKLKTTASTFEKPLINTNFTSEELIRLTTAMVTFIGFQIPSHSFQTSYQHSSKGANATSLDRCLELLLTGLLDIQSRARVHSRSPSPVDGPAWTELLKRTSVAVTEILGQMSWSSFVGIMMGILQDATPAMTKTALEELGGTLSFRSAITKADVAHLMPLIGTLVGILQKPAELTAEAAGVQRGCLFCLKQLAGILGTHSSDAWTSIMSTSTDLLDSPDLTIRCEAVSCLTTIVATVKTGVLSRLSEFLPRLLEHVHQILSNKTQDSVPCLTALEALEVVVTSLTAFLSPQLPKILSIVAMCAMRNVKMNLKDVFGAKMLKIRGVLSNDVPFRVMFAAFKETYGALKQAEVFTIFNDNLRKAKTGDILAMQRDIVDFLFTVFDSQENLAAALDALSVVALRMPESSFKGLFMKLYQWATQDGLDRKKLMTFYEIIDRLTDTLKHLFVIYAATVLSNAVSTMGTLHVEKKSAVNADDDNVLETNLLGTIFDVLLKFFKYDTTGYFNADQFDLLNQPLVDQLDNYREPVSYRRLVEHLIPAITAFTVCLNDDSLCKPLHYQVLLKTRHEEAAVRVAALQAIESLVESMGESYSNLLPEAVTFLVELSAEDDELVEAQCAKTKATIEKVLGDSTIWRNEMD